MKRSDFAKQLQSILSDIHTGCAVHLPYMAAVTNYTLPDQTKRQGYVKVSKLEDNDGIIYQKTEGLVFKEAFPLENPFRIMMEACKISSIEFEQKEEEHKDPIDICIKFNVISEEQWTGHSNVDRFEEINLMGDIGDLYLMDGNNEPVHWNSVYLQCVFKFNNVLDNWNVLFNQIANKIRKEEWKPMGVNLLKPLFGAYDNHISRKMVTQYIEQNMLAVMKKVHFKDFITADHHFEADTIDDTMMRVRSLELFDVTKANQAIVDLVKNEYDA